MTNCYVLKHLGEPHSKSSCWGGRAKLLKYHIGPPILTNVGQRHPIQPWFLTIPHPWKVEVPTATPTTLHSVKPDQFHFETSIIDSDTIARYLSTLENHTPKTSYWGGRAKLLKYHISHCILTNVGQRHPILPWFITQINSKNSGWQIKFKAKLQ